MSELRKPCPFCGSYDISDGEVLGALTGGVLYKQSECSACGATGPRAMLDAGEKDYGDVKATAAWNRRSAPASPASKPTGEDYEKAIAELRQECDATSTYAWTLCQVVIRASAFARQRGGSDGSA
jgi:Lar family restriction alleviation protein